MKHLFKSVLNPFLKFGARIINSVSDENTIMFKAASIIAVEKIEGDYLEFGVYTGRSFLKSYRTLETVFKQQQKPHAGRTTEEVVKIKEMWKNMRFFGFDSFEGLPKPSGIDKETKDFTEGKYKCSEYEFLKNISKSGVPLNKVISVAGWFNETCTVETIKKYRIESASIIHIDCDLYESTKTVLEFVTPLLQDGSIIIFDDWYCFRGNPYLGEQRAFNEWMATLTGWKFTEYQKESVFRNSFIASRIDSHLHKL